MSYFPQLPSSVVRCAPALLLGGASLCSNAQSSSKILEGAAHCLATAWLSPEQTSSGIMTLAYTSGPTGTFDDGRPVYVVSYTTANRDRGYVFNIALKTEGKLTVFTLQNNARFVRSGKNVDFVEPPVEGTWTQEHLVSAVNQISLQTTSSFHVKNAKSVNTSVSCKSYADADRQAQ
jgi:hypothetical protein